MTTSRYTIISLAILILSGCETPTSPLTGIPSDLSIATKVAAISGQDYTLSTTLWRDFQPISPPDGKPLIVVVNIIKPNAAIFSTGVRADSLWIISGNQVWSGSFLQKIDLAYLCISVKKLCGTVLSGGQAFRWMSWSDCWIRKNGSIS